MASHASLARGGFLTIRDIWAGTAPRGHRHEKPGAWRKHHLHIIKPLVVPRGCLQLRWAAWRREEGVQGEKWMAAVEQGGTLPPGVLAH